MSHLRGGGELFQVTQPRRVAWVASLQIGGVLLPHNGSARLERQRAIGELHKCVPEVGSLTAKRFFSWPYDMC